MCIYLYTVHSQVTYAMNTDAPPYHHRWWLFTDNSLRGLSHLWHVQLDSSFSQKQNHPLNHFTRLCLVEIERTKVLCNFALKNSFWNVLMILWQSLTKCGQSISILAVKDKILWWMLILYLILTTSPITSQSADCGIIHNVVICMFYKLFYIFLPLSQLVFEWVGCMKL